MPINSMFDDFLKSTALIVDDEIEIKRSKIRTIKKNFEGYGTCFISYNDIPPEITWSSFSGISFAILDWELTENNIELPAGAEVGRELLNENINNLVNFIKHLVNNYVMPIFIFSNQNIADIEARLNADQDTKWALEQNQILIKSKSNLTGKQIKKSLLSWYKKNPAVYSIKSIEKSINTAKTSLFLSFYKIGRNWPLVVYQAISDDEPCDINQEFSDFILSSISGRFETPQFDETILKKKYKINHSEINNVYGASKLYLYSNQDSTTSYTGDLYCYCRNNNSNKKEYLINITAGCDLRKNYKLFLCGIPTKKYTLDPKYGLLNKATSHYIPFTDGHGCLEFFFYKYEKISNTANFNEIILDSKTYKRIGRLTTPYISSLQNRFSHYICRQGELRPPLKVLKALKK